jgi:hypothetical protein
MASTPASIRRIRRASQSGQAIVLIGLLILVLFGMLGLAIDSGRAYVDRRDQQAAVDAAALAAGDWYENYGDLYGSTLPQSKALYQADLHLYSGPVSDSDVVTHIGPQGLQQDTDTVTYAQGYSLVITAVNTQFNGYQFTFTSTHNFPLAFMQIFGGSPNITINATATAVVGNQRQTPAILTLSTGKCSLNLTGSATLTLLGDAYSNGTACVDPNLQEAGNCYGAAGSNCSSASYYCYNATPGFVPYPPPCLPGDVQGQPIVPAPTLPDPAYLASSEPYYNALGVQATYGFSRGTWSEMYPGLYPGFFHPAGGFGCAFLDPGVYVWAGGYKDDSNGSLISNELKPPSEELYTAPGTTNLAGIQFWDQNGAGCSGSFGISVVSGLGPNGLAHKGGNGFWGVELTSVRWDQFIDPTIGPNPCFSSPGCRRESAPSECIQTPSVVDSSGVGINVSVTTNSPGAQYYNVYINANGCDGNQSDFVFYGRYLAPGWTDGGGPPAAPVGPWPNGTGVVLANGVGGFGCPAPGVTVCKVSYTSLPPTTSGYNCFSNTRSAGCYPPDDEITPQCFSSCPPPPGLLSQENAPFSLQYPPYTGGDEANENYCQQPAAAGTGNPNSPCANAKITPGAVQFYFPAGACLDQESQGATFVYAGEQYNWISIYMPATNTCNNSMNGGSATQYIGTIYTPGANWSINGGNRSPLAGQVICYTASVSGGGSVGVDFNPNYSPAPPAARLIN